MKFVSFNLMPYSGLSDDFDWWISLPADPIEADRALLDVLYHIQAQSGLQRGFVFTAVELDDDSPSGRGQPLANGSVRER